MRAHLLAGAVHGDAVDDGHDGTLDNLARDDGERRVDHVLVDGARHSIVRAQLLHAANDERFA